MFWAKITLVFRFVFFWIFLSLHIFGWSPCILSWVFSIGDVRACVRHRIRPSFWRPWTDPRWSGRCRGSGIWLPCTAREFSGVDPWNKIQSSYYSYTKFSKFPGRILLCFLIHKMKSNMMFVYQDENDEKGFTSSTEVHRIKVLVRWSHIRSRTN